MGVGHRYSDSQTGDFYQQNLVISNSFSVQTWTYCVPFSDHLPLRAIQRMIDAFEVFNKSISNRHAEEETLCLRIRVVLSFLIICLF